MVVWNCRGAAKSPFTNYVKTLLRQYNINMMCFLETHLEESVVNRIRRFFDQAWNIFMVPAVGLSGGIVIIWKKVLGLIDFYHLDRQVAFGVISLNHGPTWILGVVYASTNVF